MKNGGLIGLENSFVYISFQKPEQVKNIVQHPDLVDNSMSI